MFQSFRTILIPVDFSINTEAAIYKALELTDGTNAHIHLLHVTQCLATAGIQRSREAAETRLNQWKASLEETYPSTGVFVWIVNHPVIRQVIEQMAVRLKADLVVIGKRSQPRWLSFRSHVRPEKIALATQCALLVVKPGALRHKTKTVIVPVSENLSAAKMQALSAICRGSRVKIFLVAFSTGGRSDISSADSLLHLYQWIRNDLHCPVEHTVLYGPNRGRTLLSYARKVDADVLLLQPEEGGRIGWPSRQLADAVPSASKMQVLMVAGFDTAIRMGTA